MTLGQPNSGCPESDGGDFCGWGRRSHILDRRIRQQFWMYGRESDPPARSTDLQGAKQSCLRVVADFKLVKVHAAQVFARVGGVHMRGKCVLGLVGSLAQRTVIGPITVNVLVHKVSSHTA